MIIWLLRVIKLRLNTRREWIERISPSLSHWSIIYSIVSFKSHHSHNISFCVRSAPFAGLRPDLCMRDVGIYFVPRGPFNDCLKLSTSW